ncbi:hypothetical protein [Sphingorhabdus sp.]|uniref:hypothetical protein n=1 Tax=Sphingorhabdus sp. TaxID=1902408 RepID=UPI00333EFFBD
MNCKNCNKVLLWLAGALLAVSIVFPNGPTLSLTPTAPVAPVAVHATDVEIVRLLANASSADKARVNGIYTALVVVLKKDAGKRITTTEQWADLQANTLQLAIDTPGKYPGLDTAIEAVFLAKLGTDDVMPSTPETQAKLIDACETIAASAR